MIETIAAAGVTPAMMTLSPLRAVNGRDALRADARDERPQPPPEPLRAGERSEACAQRGPDPFVMPALAAAQPGEPWAPAAQASPAAQVSELMNRFQALLEELNQVQFSQNSALLTQLSAARRDESMRQADELSARLERAQTASTVFGWLGRLVAWVLTALTVISAIFTGGASLVVAGVIAGVTIADQIVQATTGQSPIASALDAVLRPIGEAIASAIADGLKSMGVAPDTARMVGDVLGMIIAVAVVLVATVVGVRAASKCLGPVLSKVMEKLASSAAQVMPKAVSSVGTAMAGRAGAIGDVVRSSLSRIAGCGGEITQAALLWQKAQTIAIWVNGVVASAATVTNGCLRRDVIDAQAACERFAATSRVVTRMMGESSQAYADGLSSVVDAARVSMDTLAQQRETCLLIARRAHCAA